MEDEGAGVGEITLNIDSPAPSGGLTVNVALAENAWQHTSVPETIVVPEESTDDGSDRSFPSSDLWNDE